MATSWEQPWGLHWLHAPSGSPLGLDHPGMLRLRWRPPLLPPQARNRSDSDLRDPQVQGRAHLGRLIHPRDPLLHEAVAQAWLCLWGHRLPPLHPQQLGSDHPHRGKYPRQVLQGDLRSECWGQSHGLGRQWGVLECAWEICGLGVECAGGECGLGRTSFCGLC